MFSTYKPVMLPKSQSDNVVSAAQISLEKLRAALAIASGLAAAGRTIDLRGVEAVAGLLCAQALDLPPADGQALRPSLLAINTMVTSLIASLQAKAK